MRRIIIGHKANICLGFVGQGAAKMGADNERVAFYTPAGRQNLGRPTETPFEAILLGVSPADKITDPPSTNSDVACQMHLRF